MNCNKRAGYSYGNASDREEILNLIYTAESLAIYRNITAIAADAVEKAEKLPADIRAPEERGMIDVSAPEEARYSILRKGKETAFRALTRGTRNGRENGA